MKTYQLSSNQEKKIREVIIKFFKTSVTKKSNNILELHHEKKMFASFQKGIKTPTTKRKPQMKTRNKLRYI